MAIFNKSNFSQNKNVIIIYIILAWMTFAVFWQVNQFEFISADDHVYVTENSHVTSGLTLAGIRWALTTTYAEFWHPLTWLSLMFDYQFYGLNAGGYHVTNLFLHILSTLLLFWLFNRMTGAVWRSAFVAAFFALHPLHVESVAWVSERKDVLSAFFWMLTLCLYVYYTEKPVVKRYLPVLFSFVLALMSKPMVVTLPVIMMLLDYWPLNRHRIGTEAKKDNLLLWQFKEKLPFFVLSGIFSIITIYAQYKPHWQIIPLDYRMSNAPVACVFYLGKIFLPLHLSFLYPIPEEIQVWEAMGSFLLILVISAYAIRTMKRFPFLLIGWLWYAITILPVLGVMHIGVHRLQDLYTYIPSIGITVGMAWWIPSLTNHANVRKKILLPASIIFFIMIASLTYRQCGYWKNDIELFTRAVSATKNNHLAYDNRGVVYGKMGSYQKAIADFNKAITLKSDYFRGYNNRGFAYAAMGQYQKAFNDYDEAIRLNPDYAKAYANRAIAYFNLGHNISGCNDAQKACALGDCSSLQTVSHKGLCR